MLLREITKFDRRNLLILICNSLNDVVEIVTLLFFCDLIYIENFDQIVVMNFSFYENIVYDC